MAETKKTSETKPAAKAATPKAATAKSAAPKTTTAKPAATKSATTKTVAPKATAEKVQTKPAEAADVKVAPATKPVAKPVVKAEKKPAGKLIKVTLVKSSSGRLIKQQRTLEALGLGKLHSSHVVPDNAATRGMIFVVKHLVSVEEVK